MATVESMTKALKLQLNVSVSGPYFKFSCRYGDRTTLHCDMWYVSKKLPKAQQKTEFQKILGKTCLGCIIKFRNRKEYVIDQLYPHKALPSLQKAVDFLIKNQGKLVFCS
ncbi:MAG: hypothetical protein D4S01_09170 [Dehalococcoidia bacterium]|nr:MAG: hypothetical protein D4S01_09170 [Dehalococcoidia bacterium]